MYQGFSILVQLSLASLAFVSLLYKRHLETPKRPLTIWCLDVSKQALSSIIVHFTNIFLSSNLNVNPCILYFLHILLDTTVGVGLLYVCLGCVYSIARLLNMSHVDQGIYEFPNPLISWLKQFSLFLISWMLVKFIVMFCISHMNFLQSFAKWILSPLILTGNVELQIVVVMFLFPLVMNIIQAWLIDLIIKGKMGYYTVVRKDEEED